MGKKRDIRDIEAVAIEYGMVGVERRKFGDYIEKCKLEGERGSGAKGDFTCAELRGKASEFREERG
jgi:hypothetical protein